MANWLINLNWQFHAEIWQNCRKNGRAAIGWSNASDDDLADVSSYQKAVGYFAKIQPGDRVIAFLKDRRLGGWGVVNMTYDANVYEPQLAPGTENEDFGRVIGVRWEDKKTPPNDKASRMKPEDVTGFTCLSTINHLSDEAFERLKKIIEDESRWELIAELFEEAHDDEYQESSTDGEEWHSPLRESALRRIIAEDLSKLEAGLLPFDEKAGAEEYSVGDAGRIDLFCKDKEGNPVVVELKRDTSSDAVVGQLARYMGYIKKNHLPKGKIVRGIIVSHDAEDKMLLALEAIPNTEFKYYEVKVSFRQGPTTS